MTGFTKYIGSTILAATLCTTAFAQQAVKDVSASKAVHQTIISNLDQGGDLLVVANMDGAVEDIVKAIVAISELAPDSDDNKKNMTDAAAKLPAFLKKNGLYGLKGFGLSVAPRTDGLNDIKTFIYRDPAARDTTVWRLLSSGQPKKLAGLDFLPADTVYAGIGDGDIKMLWKLIRSSVQEFGSQETARKFDTSISGFSTNMGFDVEKAFASVGEEAFFSIQFSKTAKIDIPAGTNGVITIPRPAFLIGIAVSNNAVQDALTRMIQSGKIPMSTTQADGITLSSVNLPIPLPVPVQPTYATVSHYFLLGSSPEVVADAIKASRSGSGLTSTAEFKKLFEGQPMVNNGLSYMSPRLAQTIIDIQKQAARSSSGAGNSAQESAIGKLWGMQSNQVSAVVYLNTRDGIQTKGITSQSGRQTVASIIMVPVGVLGAIAIPSFVKARSTATKNGCINNLRQIDAAVEQWALAAKKEDGAPVDLKGISGYLRGNKMPKCPKGGVYTIKAVGDSPSCSVHGTMENVLD